MSIPKLTIKISNTSSSNFIAILDCLNPALDISSPRRSYEDLSVKLIGKDKPEKINQNVQLITCENKHQFLNAFNNLNQHFSIPGFKPTILIHAHGDEKHGLQLPDHSFVAWPKLIEMFGVLTETCDGDLTIIAGFCYSFELIKHIPKNIIKSPFSFYYGYTNKIKAGTVEDEINIIIKSFIDDGGKSLFSLLSKLRIRSFSEFDFIMPLLVHTLTMAAAPKELSKLAPILSQKKIKKSVRSKHNGPQRGIDNLIKLIVRSEILSVEIIKIHMHNTERRTYAFQAVENYFTLLKKNEQN